MTEIGEVIKIDGEKITILCKPSATCHSCNSEMCHVKNRELAAKNPRKIQLKSGDFAEIFLPPSQAVSAGFQVFMVPLLLFVGFFFGARYGLGFETEGPPVLFGLLGLGIGFFVSYFLGRSTKCLPEVVKKLDGDELKNALSGEVPISEQGRS